MNENNRIRALTNAIGHGLESIRAALWDLDGRPPDLGHAAYELGRITDRLHQLVELLSLRPADDQADDLAADFEIPEDLDGA